MDNDYNTDGHVHKQWICSLPNWVHSIQTKILSICFNILIIIEAFILTNQMFEITFSKIIKLDSWIFENKQFTWIKIKLFLTSKKYFFSITNQSKCPKKFGHSIWSTVYTLKNQNNGTGIGILQLFHTEVTHCWPV